MASEEDRATAAASLNMSLEGLAWLEKLCLPFRYTDQVWLRDPIAVYEDLGGAKIWEVEVIGQSWARSADAELNARFAFRIRIADLDPQRGSSQRPDWFRIAVNGTAVFDGKIKHPNDLDDGSGWIRYDLFGPIRLRAWEAVVANIITQRMQSRVNGS